MRVIGLTMAALLLVSGCAAPPPLTGRETLEAFHAAYVTTQKVPEGVVDGVLRVTLDGPFNVADRDMVVRPAYTLSITWDRRLDDGQNWTTLGTFGMDYYIDGAFRVVRTESHNVMGSDGRLRHADWDLQGVPPPLGFAWQVLIPGSQFMVEGRTMPGTVEWEDGWATLAGFDALPLDVLVTYGARYRYAGPRDLIPQEFELPGPTPAQVTQGTFNGKFGRGPLPPISPWPLLAYAEGHRPSKGWQVFPGEWEDPMGVGSSLDEVLAQAVVEEPALEPFLDGGCLTQAVLHPAGGSRGIDVAGLLAPGSAAALQLTLFYVADGKRHKFDLHHWSDGQESTTTVESTRSEPNSWEPTLCAIRDHAAPRTLLESMWAGYQLPLHNSGVPCGADHLAQEVATPAGRVAMGSRDTLLMRFSEDNDATGPRSLASLAWDEEAGMWDSMVLHYLDMSLLDSGTWDPREVPPMTLQDLRPRPHCVAPTPRELPLEA